jgi:hypothetical protein
MSRSEGENYAQNRARAEELERRATRIRELNDAFRTNMYGGRWMITRGVQALGVAAMNGIVALVRSFDNFSEGNDPHQEHDFGSFEWHGQKIFWKIDCYDKQLEFGSPDAADPEVTARVLTILLAEEY